MNIVFFGSDSFGIPALERLKKISDLLVITEHDKAMGRGRKLAPLPIKSFARDNNLKLIETDNCNEPEVLVKIKEFKPDFLVVASFGQILGQELLTMAKYMPLNIHPSLLPRYRGAAPIRRAIINAENEIGISIIKMVKKLDAGSIILQKKISLTDKDIYTELFNTLSELGADSLLKSIDLIINNKYTLIEQDVSMATYASKISRSDYYLNLYEDAKFVLRRINAFSLKPGAIINFREKPFKIIYGILSPALKLQPNTLYAINKHLYLGTTTQAIEVIKIQPAGKSVISGKDFINGYSISDNIKLDEGK